MPAHVPCRNFAKPFIVTVAAATTAACAATPIYDNPPQNPPAQDTAAPSATTAPPVEPTTSPQAQASEDQTWTLERSQNGTCTAQGHIGNSPPPMPYTCPANVPRFPSTIVLAKGASECTVRVYYLTECPPNVFCNPPPPKNVVVPCPK